MRPNWSKQRLKVSCLKHDKDLTEVKIILEKYAITEKLVVAFGSIIFYDLWAFSNLVANSEREPFLEAYGHSYFP
jgi:hypothetical protein